MGRAGPATGSAPDQGAGATSRYLGQLPPGLTPERFAPEIVPAVETTLNFYAYGKPKDTVEIEAKDTLPDLMAMSTEELPAEAVRRALESLRAAKATDLLVEAHR